jgi:hypothetical protein
MLVKCLNNVTPVADVVSIRRVGPRLKKLVNIAWLVEDQIFEVSIWIIRKQPYGR